MQTRKCIFSQHVHLSRPPYRHFERSREIFLALRFSDICILRFTACNRDPSTSLGMTIHAKRYQKLRRSRHLPRRTQRTCLNLLNPFSNYIVKMYDAIMSTMSMTKRSGAVRLARRIGASPAVPAIAMRAPQTGDEARPMEVASSIGRSSVSVGTPSFAATAGVSGPKAKSGTALARRFL